MNLEGELPQRNEDIWDEFRNSLTQNYNAWMDFLSSWCGGHSTFIREFGFPQRRITRSIGQLHKQLLYFGYQKRKSSYISIYEFREQLKAKDDDRPNRRKRDLPIYSTAVVNRHFIDIDVSGSTWSSLEKSWDELLKVYDDFSGKGDIYFSAGKGFHHYLHCRPSIPSPKGWKDMGEYLIAHLPSTAIDRAVSGDVARISRIPFTPHGKYGRYCIPVTADMDIQNILEKSMEPQIPYVRKKTWVDLSDYSVYAKEFINENSH